MSIASDVVQGDKTFTCHKTLDKPKKDQSHCHGALVMIENMGADNQTLRIAGRLGLYIYTDIPEPSTSVFESPEAMGDHHNWNNW